MTQSQNKIAELITALQEKLDKIEKLKEQIETIKDESSFLCEELLPIVSAGKTTAKNKFRFNGDWFLIKFRDGRYFIVNFGEVEPGSWLWKKNRKVKSDDEG